VTVPDAFVQSLSVETVRQTKSFSLELAAARAFEAETFLAKERREAASVSMKRETETGRGDENESFEAVTYRFEDVPLEEIVSATTVSVPAELAELDEEFASDMTASSEVLDVAEGVSEATRVVAAMKDANQVFERAAARARAAAEKANAAAKKLRDTAEDSERFDEVQAEVEHLSEEAVAAVRAAKLAKEEVTTTTSAVAALAREEARLAALAAEAAAADAEAAADADDVTAADLKAAEERLAAEAIQKELKAQRKTVEAQNLASFEFPEFQVPEFPTNAKVGGAAVVAGLGVAGLAAEADVASSLMQLGGEAAVTTAFAFLFANNMVFAKDREKVMDSLESRQAFEKFILSGQWLGKDSFAGEVARDALAVFDPLGIAADLSDGEKRKKTPKQRTESPEVQAGTEMQAAANQVEQDVKAEKLGTAVKAEKAPEKETWSRFFGGKKRKKEPVSAETNSESSGPSNDVVSVSKMKLNLGEDEMEDAFMAFGAPTRKRPPPGFEPSSSVASTGAPSEAKKRPEPPSGKLPPPVGLPTGKRGVSSFLDRRAGNPDGRFVVKSKPADPNSVEAIQYRKEMAAARAAGVPYSTWVKKSREDLSTLTWQELAERMKKPYDPNERGMTDDAGAR